MPAHWLPFLGHGKFSGNTELDPGNEQTKTNLGYLFAQPRKQLRHLAMRPGAVIGWRDCVLSVVVAMIHVSSEELEIAALIAPFLVIISSWWKLRHHLTSKPTRHCHRRRFNARAPPFSCLVSLQLAIRIKPCLVCATVGSKRVFFAN